MLSCRPKRSSRVSCSISTTRSCIEAEASPATPTGSLPTSHGGSNRYLARMSRGSRRLVVGIVSNGAESSRRETVARLSFRRHVTTVLSSERAGVKKPDPRVFTKAATELGLANSQSVFVGDHLSTMSKVRCCPECAPSGSKASTAGRTAWPRPSPPHRPWRKSETTSHG
ncbi:HAD family hydrolase [Variovorax gossypii]